MKKIVCIILGLCMLLSLTACHQSSDAPLQLPEASAVTSVVMRSTNDVVLNTIDNQEEIASLLEALADNESTGKISKNERPDHANQWVAVEINAEGDVFTTLYVYQDDGEYYVDQPYIGIYRLSSAPNNWLA